MNNVLKIIAVVVVIALAVLVVRFIGRDDPSARIQTRLYTVRKGDIEKTIYGTGILKCSERAEVVSEVKGKIKRIAVKEGQAVKKGDTLAEIENNEIDNEIKVQNALIEKLKKEVDELNKDIEEQRAVKTARLARDQAKLEYDTKQKELDDEKKRVKDGLTSKYSADEMARLEKEVDALKGKYELAERQYEDSKPTEATIKEAEGKYNNEKEKLSTLEKAAKGRNMTAPIDSIILKVYIDEEILKIDPEKEFEVGTPYFLAANLESVIIEGTVFESDIGRVKLDQPVKVFLTQQSKAYQQGKVTKISLTPGKEMGRFDVRVGFIQPPQGIKEGVRVNFEIIVEKLDDVVIVPVEYVKNESGRRYVTVRTNGRDEKREVKLGIADNHSYQVLQGLSEGEKAVLETKAVE
jgi:HlyD family secretion protein